MTVDPGYVIPGYDQNPGTRPPQPFTMHSVFLLDRTSPAALTETAGGAVDVETVMYDGRFLAALDHIEWPTNARDDH